ncbi:MAG TPA: PIN domain-containing protein [Candidatus Limnocylindria bacterium]|nr:PIN domain-containing protein [Candidatus Limnocylindria bacterium]
MLSSSKKLVDANILLRLILQDDEQLFQKALHVVQDAGLATLVTTPIIAAEVLYVLGGRGYSREQSAQALLLLTNRASFLEDIILQKSLQLYAETRLDFPDCYLAIRALATKEQLETFDKPLLKLYNRLKENRNEAKI